LSDGLDSSSSNEYDTTSSSNKHHSNVPNIIEIEYDGNPNDLIVNFEELENDPNRYQMVIGNYKLLLAQQQQQQQQQHQQNRSDENAPVLNATSFSKIHTTHLLSKLSSHRNKYNYHKRARLSTNRN